MPAAMTCTRPSCSAPACSWPARRRPGRCPGRVRLIFQPAEEVPGGALDVLAAGGIASVDRIFALHCDPRLDVGKVGTRTGPITAACDKITVRVSGPGGHTARPHLTADLVYALGKIITELPAALSRRVDPRSSLSLVWGRVTAGSAANAIPDDGEVEGTVRCLDDNAWHAAPDLLKALIESVASAYGVVADLTYQRNVPPTVNETVSTAMFEAAIDRVLGADAITPAPQSLGGEDFAWYLESVPGALARLGTRTPGSADDFDIHQPAFDVDERAIGLGVRIMAATALTAMCGGTATATDGRAPIARRRWPDLRRIRDSVVTSAARTVESPGRHRRGRSAAEPWSASVVSAQQDPAPPVNHGTIRRLDQPAGSAQLATSNGHGRSWPRRPRARPRRPRARRIREPGDSGARRIPRARVREPAPVRGAGAELRASAGPRPGRRTRADGGPPGSG